MEIKYYELKAKSFILVFENEILKALWDEELTGQISDGMWENTPNSAWPFWCSIKTKVGKNNKLISTNNCSNDYTFYNIKRNFGFTRLIKYVGDEMVEIGKRFDPSYNEKRLRKDLQTISKTIKGEI